MDVDRHRVQLAVHGDQVEQSLRKHAPPALLVVEEVQFLDLFGVDVGEELLAGVPLIRVRRVVGEQTVRELGLRVGSGTTCDCRVDHLDVGILLRVQIEQRFFSFGVTTARPPREELELLTVAAVTAGRGAIVVVIAAARGEDQSHDDRESEEHRPSATSEDHHESPCLPDPSMCERPHAQTTEFTVGGARERRPDCRRTRRVSRNGLSTALERMCCGCP